MPTVFSQIGAELRSLYDIGYLSTHDPHEENFRKGTIRCHRANAVVRSKPGYYPQ
ncbi:MAG: hypothetical protein JOY85_01255 [Acidobacteriaceae bacterium]|nr:hypothetical protein [Acidobacteriaceae bacterium]